MRQFGRCQVFPPPPRDPSQPHIHKYSRKGGNKTAHDWETKLRPFVEQWRTTSSVHWHEEALFDRAAHEAYLKWYRSQTRLRYMPRADPEDMETAHTSTSETHYSSVTSGIDHAAQLTLEAQEETAAIINRLTMGIEMTPSENLAAWQRTESKLRRIFETLRHRCASDTLPSHEAHSPPCPSHRAKPTFQPTPMAWRQPTLRLLPPPSPTQSGGSSWYHQPHPPPAQLSVMMTTGSPDTPPPPATQVILAMPPPAQSHTRKRHRRPTRSHRGAAQGRGQGGQEDDTVRGRTDG